MTLLTLVLGGYSAFSRCTILCSVAIRSVSSGVDQRSTSPSPKSRRYEVLIAVCMLFSSLSKRVHDKTIQREQKNAQQENRGGQCQVPTVRKGEGKLPVNGEPRKHLAGKWAQ